MRLQHVSVIFIVIFIPIILITSHFINLQVETIKLESDYDEKLLNATYDAMTAFELNTANEDLSTVSDSLRSIIEASNNIFFNTLCTNLGVSNASKSYVQPYIPAILYTLYDGYYLYTPTDIPEICVDDFGRTIRTSDFGVKYKEFKTIEGINVGFYEFNKNAIKYSDSNKIEPENVKTGYADYKVDYNTLDIEDEYGQILYKNKDGTYSTKIHNKSAVGKEDATYFKRDYILKSYIPYSATYTKAETLSNPAIDITINYTLDNFMTIEGSVGNVYYTKSGYFIDKNLIDSIEINRITGSTSEVIGILNTTSWKNYLSEITDEKNEGSKITLIDSYIYNPANYEVKVNFTNGEKPISNQDGKVPVSKGDGSGNEIKYWEDVQSAVKYYVDSYVFSMWIYENLSGITASELKNHEYSVSEINENVSTTLDDKTNLHKDVLYDFVGDTAKPFSDIENDPENEESVFYKHKRNVIKNSITYNLILSMIVYTEESRTVEFNMPVFEESEWDRILNNVSIVSFMEGMKCGLKYYNNYAIVTSTNNEISVTNNEIYYVPRVLQKVDTITNAQIISQLDDDESMYKAPYTAPKYETAHRIDCEKLVLDKKGTGEEINFWGDEWLGCYSFKSKEIKYDKILNSEGRYLYDHKVYTDYDCIVDSNYTVKNVNGGIEDGNTDVLKYLLDNVKVSSPTDSDLQEHLKWKLLAYRIAIAKERNNLYKTTAFPENYGWQVVYLGDSGKKATGGSVTIDLSSLPSTRKINEIKKIEITIENAEQKSPGVYTSDISAKYNDGSEYSQKQTIATTSKNRRTIEYSQDFDSTATVSNITLSYSDVEFVVKAIKVYYK